MVVCILWKIEGTISYSEFISASLALSPEEMIQKYQDAFDKMDQNGTGYLERCDLETLLSSISSENEIDNLLAHFDDSKDGKISRDEFISKLTQ